MQVDPDALSKVIRLVHIQSQRAGLVGNCFHSANQYLFYEVGIPRQKSVHAGILSKR